MIFAVSDQELSAGAQEVAESDVEFDTRMLKSRASFIGHYNATFDFEAGLNEVYARANLVRPGGPGALPQRRRPRRRPGSSTAAN